MRSAYDGQRLYHSEPYRISDNPARHYFVFGGYIDFLVAYKFEFLGKKAWFGNSCSVWTLIMCIVAAIVLLAFKLFWLLPCILLIPIAVLGVRYCWLEHRKKKVLKYRGVLDYDKKRYDYYVWLSKRELFRWEVKKYLLPAMNILFEIGSIKKLDDELEQLSDYKDWYKWKRLKSYVHWNRHEYQEVVELMAPYIDEGKLSGTELTRVTINIYEFLYRNLEDREGIEIYAKEIGEYSVRPENLDGRTLRRFDVLL